MGDISRVQTIKQTKNEGGTEQPKLILVEASKLKKNDQFMRYTPVHDLEREFKNELQKVIEHGVSDFYRFNCDPVYANNWSSITYQFGKLPATGKDLEWWIKQANDLNGRIGERYEYIAFLGTIIKKLVEKGWSKQRAWNAVCVDSKCLGNYADSGNRIIYELTGSGEVCGFYDLGNTHKILCETVKNQVIWYIGGGYYVEEGKNSPLATTKRYLDWAADIFTSVAWIVFDKNVTLEK